MFDIVIDGVKWSLRCWRRPDGTTCFCIRTCVVSEAGTTRWLDADECEQFETLDAAYRVLAVRRGQLPF